MDCLLFMIIMLILPIPNLNLSMSNIDFSFAVRLRLGLPFSDQPSSCAGCNGTLDPLGHHALNCRQSAQFKSRHDNLRDLLDSQACKALLNSRIEVSGIFDDSGEKPADVYIPRYQSGKPAAIDISLINPLSVNVVERAAKEAGAALKERVDAKCQKYSAKCDAKDVEFIPFILEVFGGFDVAAIKVVSRIAKGQAAQGWTDKKTAKRQIFQQFSVALQTKLVSSILHAFGG